MNSRLAERLKALIDAEKKRSRLREKLRLMRLERTPDSGKPTVHELNTAYDLYMEQDSVAKTALLNLRKYIRETYPDYEDDGSWP